MKVVAFVGGSGTGKSYRASWLAKEGKLDFIIDDGLLIHKNRIIAGKSAKREATKLASVRRALFTDPSHAADVRKAISEMSAESVLIIGTSEKMVESIREKLELPEFQYIIHIEDVAAPQDIEQAKQARRSMGKHVIPVPTFEVRKHFAGYVIDSIKIFLGFDKGQMYEASKTVVRPTFSYLGDYIISDQAIIDLSTNAVSKFREISSVMKTVVKQVDTGIYINLDVNLNFSPQLFGQGNTFEDLSARLQKKIKYEVEKYTLIHVEGVNITVKTMTVSKA